MVALGFPPSNICDICFFLPYWEEGVPLLLSRAAVATCAPCPAPPTHPGPCSNNHLLLLMFHSSPMAFLLLSQYARDLLALKAIVLALVLRLFLSLSLSHSPLQVCPCHSL